jgi:hypothetical protein
MGEQQIKQEVFHILHKLNSSWAVEGNADKLKKYFHENIVVFELNRKESGRCCLI